MAQARRVPPQAWSRDATRISDVQPSTDRFPLPAQAPSTDDARKRIHRYETVVFREETVITLTTWTMMGWGWGSAALRALPRHDAKRVGSYESPACGDRDAAPVVSHPGKGSGILEFRRRTGVRPS